MRVVAVIRSIRQSIRACSGTLLQVRRDIQQGLRVCAFLAARAFQELRVHGVLHPRRAAAVLRLQRATSPVVARVTGGACPTSLGQCSSPGRGVRRRLAD
jgi:hypothetical protein